MPPLGACTMRPSKQSMSRKPRPWLWTIRFARLRTMQTVSSSKQADPTQASRSTVGQHADSSSSRPFVLSAGFLFAHTVFSCYQYVTETHCSATTPVPYGVCNMNGPDTSRAVKKATSAATRSQTGAAWRWTVALGGLVACFALQLMDN